MRRKRNKNSFLVRGLRRNRTRFPVHGYIKKHRFKAIMFTALIEKFVDQINAVDNDGFTPIMLLLIHNRADGIYALFSRANAHNIAIDLDIETPDNSGTVVHLALSSEDPMTVKTFFQQGHSLLRKEFDAYDLNLFEESLLNEHQPDTQALLITHTLLRYKFEPPRELSDGSTIIENVLSRLHEVKTCCSTEEYERYSHFTIKIASRLLKNDMQLLLRCKQSTSIHHCIYYNLPDVLYYMLDAVQANNPELLPSLLYESDTSSLPPLVLCTIKERHAEFTQLGFRETRTACASVLIEFGADVNRPVSNICDFTPVSFCFRFDVTHPATIALALLFLENGANIQREKDIRKSMLRRAIMQCNERIILKILEKQLFPPAISFSSREYKNALTLVIQRAFSLSISHSIEKILVLVDALQKYGVPLQVATVRAMLKYFSSREKILPLLKALLTHPNLSFSQSICNKNHLLSFAVIYENLRVFGHLFSKKEYWDYSSTNLALIAENVKGCPRLVCYRNSIAVDMAKKTKPSRRSCDLCCGSVAGKNLKLLESNSSYSVVVCESCFYFQGLGNNRMEIDPLDVALRRRSIKTGNDLFFLKKINRGQLEGIKEEDVEVAYLRDAKIDNALLHKGLERLRRWSGLG